MNYEEASTTNTSTLSSSGNSFYTTLNNSINVNAISKFSNKNATGSFFGNIKGSKHLNFDGVDPHDNDPKTSYLSNPTSNNNSNSQMGNFISGLLKNHKDSLTPEFKK